jgi:hypothetical protein
LLDEPTVVIVERILADIARMGQDVNRVRNQFASKACSVDELRSRERAVTQFVA